MKATFEADRFRREQDDYRTTCDTSGAPQDGLAPVIAGAFARGMAETFNLLAIPVLFFDRHGHVLFASASASSDLAPGLVLSAGHLLATADRDNASLAEFMAEVLRDPRIRRSVRLEVSGAVLSALPSPGSLGQIDQLLHAIVVIGDV